MSITDAEQKRQEEIFDVYLKAYNAAKNNLGSVTSAEFQAVQAVAQHVWDRQAGIIQTWKSLAEYRDQLLEQFRTPQEVTTASNDEPQPEQPDDAEWIARAEQAAKGGYHGHEESMEFIRQRLKRDGEDGMESGQFVYETYSSHMRTFDPLAFLPGWNKFIKSYQSIWAAAEEAVAARTRQECLSNDYWEPDEHIRTLPQPFTSLYDIARHPLDYSTETFVSVARNIIKCIEEQTRQECADLMAGQLTELREEVENEQAWGKHYCDEMVNLQKSIQAALPALGKFYCNMEHRNAVQSLEDALKASDKPGERQTEIERLRDALSQIRDAINHEVTTKAIVSFVEETLTPPAATPEPQPEPPSEPSTGFWIPQLGDKVRCEEARFEGNIQSIHTEWEEGGPTEVTCDVSCYGVVWEGVNARNLTLLERNGVPQPAPKPSEEEAETATSLLSRIEVLEAQLDGESLIPQLAKRLRVLEEWKSLAESTGEPK